MLTFYFLLRVLYERVETANVRFRFLTDFGVAKNIYMPSNAHWSIWLASHRSKWLRREIALSRCRYDIDQKG